MHAPTKERRRYSYKSIARFIVVAGSPDKAISMVEDAKGLADEDAGVKFAIEMGGFDQALNALKELIEQPLDSIKGPVGVNGWDRNGRHQHSRP